MKKLRARKRDDLSAWSIDEKSPDKPSFQNLSYCNDSENDSPTFKGKSGSKKVKKYFWLKRKKILLLATPTLLIALFAIFLSYNAQINNDSSPVSATTAFVEMQKREALALAQLKKIRKERLRARALKAKRERIKKAKAKKKESQYTEGPVYDEPVYSGYSVYETYDNSSSGQSGNGGSRVPSPSGKGGGSENSGGVSPDDLAPAKPAGSGKRIPR